MPDRIYAYGDLELRLHGGPMMMRHINTANANRARSGIRTDSRARVIHHMRHPPPHRRAPPAIPWPGGGYSMKAYNFLIGKKV